MSKSIEHLPAATIYGDTREGVENDWKQTFLDGRLDYHQARADKGEIDKSEVWLLAAEDFRKEYPEYVVTDEAEQVVADAHSEIINAGGLGTDPDRPFDNYQTSPYDYL